MELIAGIAAVLFIAGLNPIVVIVLAALLGIALLPVPEKKQDAPLGRFPRPENSFFILIAVAAIFFVVLTFSSPISHPRRYNGKD